MEKELEGAPVSPETTDSESTVEVPRSELGQLLDTFNDKNSSVKAERRRKEDERREKKAKKDASRPGLADARAEAERREATEQGALVFKSLARTLEQFLGTSPELEGDDRHEIEILIKLQRESEQRGISVKDLQQSISEARAFLNKYKLKEPKPQPLKASQQAKRQPPQPLVSGPKSETIAGGMVNRLTALLAEKIPFQENQREAYLRDLSNLKTGHHKWASMDENDKLWNKLLARIDKTQNFVEEMKVRSVEKINSKLAELEELKDELASDIDQLQTADLTEMNGESKSILAENISIFKGIVAILKMKDRPESYNPRRLQALIDQAEVCIRSNEDVFALNEITRRENIDPAITQKLEEEMVGKAKVSNKATRKEVVEKKPISYGTELNRLLKKPIPEDEAGQRAMLTELRSYYNWPGLAKSSNLETRLHQKTQEIEGIIGLEPEESAAGALRDLVARTMPDSDEDFQDDYAQLKYYITHPEEWQDKDNDGKLRAKLEERFANAEARMVGAEYTKETPEESSQTAPRPKRVKVPKKNATVRETERLLGEPLPETKEAASVYYYELLSKSKYSGWEKQPEFKEQIMARLAEAEANLRNLGGTIPHIDTPSRIKGKALVYKGESTTESVDAEAAIEKMLDPNLSSEEFLALVNAVNNRKQPGKTADYTSETYKIRPGRSMNVLRFDNGRISIKAVRDEAQDDTIETGVPKERPRKSVRETAEEIKSMIEDEEMPTTLDKAKAYYLKLVGQARWGRLDRFPELKSQLQARLEQAKKNVARLEARRAEDDNIVDAEPIRNGSEGHKVIDVEAEEERVEPVPEGAPLEHKMFEGYAGVIGRLVSNARDDFRDGRSEDGERRLDRAYRLLMSGGISDENVRNYWEEAIRAAREDNPNLSDAEIADMEREDPADAQPQPGSQDGGFWSGIFSRFRRGRGPESAANNIERARRADERETIRAIKNLAPEEREKLGRGLRSIGYDIEDIKNKTLSEVYTRVGAHDDNAWGRFFNFFKRGADKKASQMRDRKYEIESGDAKFLGNVGYVAGNTLKISRILGLASGTVFPGRYVMLGAQLGTVVATGAKESRLTNKEVINKTRIEDADEAAEEAWRVFERAQARNGGNEETIPSADALDAAYRREVPADLLLRLSRRQPEGFFSKFAGGLVAKDLEYEIRWMERGLQQIEKNRDLSPQEKQQKIDRYLGRYAIRLHDYDRLIGQAGTIDTAAMWGRAAETAGKAVVGAMMIDTLHNIFGASLSRMWNNIGNFFTEGRQTIDPEFDTSGGGRGIVDGIGRPGGTTGGVTSPENYSEVRFGGGVEMPGIEGAGDYVQTAGRGDSVWRMLERELHETYGTKFDSLNEAQKTYWIDALKDKVVENPAAFGLTDADKVAIGQEINFSSLFQDQSGIDSAYAGAMGLTEEEMRNILHNNQMRALWGESGAPDFELPTRDAGEVLDGAIGNEIVDNATGNIEAGPMYTTTPPVFMHDLFGNIRAVHIGELPRMPISDQEIDALYDNAKMATLSEREEIKASLRPLSERIALLRRVQGIYDTRGEGNTVEARFIGSEIRRLAGTINSKYGVMYRPEIIR